MSVVRQVLPTTPYKQLAVAPTVSSEQTDTDGGKKKRGLNIVDEIKLAFLSAWIRWSEVPFSFCLSQHKSKKAKVTIEIRTSVNTYFQQMHFGVQRKHDEVC